MHEALAQGKEPGRPPLLRARDAGLRAPPEVPRVGRARAGSNIALVKYWGKRDTLLNLPLVGSISLTLDALWTETEVRLVPGQERDRFWLNGREDAVGLHRVAAVLDLLRERAGERVAAHVDSRNSFPTGAGLASSASGFAALVMAGAAAFGLRLAPFELSVLARRGSGSASRSIFGGYVEWRRGVREDGDDSHAMPVKSADHWPLRVLIAVTSRAEKAVGSSVGMNRTLETSPFGAGWARAQDADLDRARSAIIDRDFAALAEVAEHSCLKMHALAMSAQPGLIYWNAATLACLHRVRALRASGVPVFFTIDAGPQLKAVCEPSAVPEVRAALVDVPGVIEVIDTGLGGAAQLLPAPVGVAA